jgi:hypothetical protein
MIHPPRVSDGWGAPASFAVAASAPAFRKGAISPPGGLDETGSLLGMNNISTSYSPPMMAHATSNVQSRGNVSATFQVPGLVTIPSDGEKHTFTIVQLNLEAEMSWVVVPKKDLRVHLKVG